MDRKERGIITLFLKSVRKNPLPGIQASFDKAEDIRVEQVLFEFSKTSTLPRSDFEFRRYPNLF